MSISMDVYYTLLNQGFECAGGVTVRATQAVYTPLLPTPVFQTYVLADLIPLYRFAEKLQEDDLNPSPDPFYESVINSGTCVFYPKFVYNDVVKFEITKVAYEDRVLLTFYDASDNVLHSAYLNASWQTCRATNPLPPPDYIIESYEVYLCLVGTYDSGTDTYGAGFAIAYENIYKNAIGFSWISPYNYGVSPTIDGFTEDYLTGVLDGKYWQAGGNPAPSGGSGGGSGDFWYNNEDVLIPALPSISACDTGFISLYAMSTAELTALASDLWSSNFFNTIVKNFNSPFDNIISLGIIPFVVTGTTTTLTIGNYTSPTTGDKLASTFYELDMGNITVIPYYDTFADYEIKIQLYAPYAGIIDLNPADVVGKTVNVKYHVDVFSGSCVVYVRVVDNLHSQVLYTKEGNCRVEMPFSGRDYAQYYNGIQAAGIQMGLGAGGLMAGNGMAIGTLASGMATAVNAKPATQRGGNVSGTASYMNIQHPYLIYTIPNYFKADNMKDLKGFVSNLECTIGDETGFLSASVDNEQLIDFTTATDDEKELIKAALAEGIYI